MFNQDITNLTCDELIMKIVWSLCIHKFVYFSHKYYVLKHIWHIDKYVDKQNFKFPLLNVAELG
jgi:hypothetical protein